MGQFAKRDTFEKDGLRVTMTKITQFFSCNLLEEISRGYMIIWKDFTNMLTVFEKLQFIFRKYVYFDFLAYYEILTPLKLRALFFWVNINLSIVQYCFQTVVQLSVISESVHIPSSKLILTEMNTNYLAPSRGAQLCLKSCFKAISSHGLISINFCYI